MFSAIWEFFFCPQHGILIQCWFMVPIALAMSWYHIKRAAKYLKSVTSKLLR